MSMESFGFDFTDLDFGWNSASPNGNSSIGFSVGTPTGVQSLGDDGFGADFSFMESPNANASATSNANASSSVGTSSSSTAPAAAAPATATSTAPSNAKIEITGASFNAATAASAGSNAPTIDKKVKNENTSGSTNGNGSGAAPTSVPPAQSSTTTSAPSAAPNEQKVKTDPSSSVTNANNVNGYQRTTPSPVTLQSFNAKSTPSSTASTSTHPGGKPTAAPTHAPNASSSMNAPMTHASASVSSSRPHIDGTTSTTAPAVPPSSRGHNVTQERYQPNQMAPNQPPHGQVQGYPPQAFGMNPMMQPGQGQPPMQQNPQYMQQPQYRPQPSVYDEDMMRVKSMMMQHPDLIPPPVEVLRVSMARSSVNPMMQNMQNYVPRMSPQGQGMNRMPPGYAPVGAPPNPGMMMQGPNQTGMIDPRTRAIQMAANQRIQQTRSSGQSGAPDLQTAWQSENDLPLRRRMIGKIVSLLQQRKPDAPAEWIRRLPDMARRLEDSLYRTAKNRDEYGDFSSLKTRLQHLAVTMGARAQSKGNARSAGVPTSNMMSSAMPPNMTTMAPGMNVGMAPQGMANVAYGNPMTPQQLQMMQNPQMRQQLTPQQFQQLQAAQMQRRQYQMQQAQMQRNSMQGQPPQGQQYQQNSAMQRPNSARGQPGGPSNQQQMQMSSQASNFLQQPGQMPNSSQAQGQPMQGQSQAQNPQQRGMNNAARQGADALSQGLVSDSADLLNFDLSQSFMNDDDDLDASLGADAMKGDHTMVGTKRNLAQSQHQLAAAANAAAFKRSKVAGAADSSDSQTQVQGAGGSSKAPSMSTVNAK